MAIKESALSLITSIAQGDWVRAVTSAGASRRVTVANLAKAIVESYTGSSLAGSAQSVKAAIDSLNSKTQSTITAASGWTAGDVNKCTKVNQMVSLDYWCSASTVTVRQWTTIGTVPSNYRPAYAFDFVAVDNSGVTSGVQTKIESAGAIKVYLTDNRSLSLRLHAVYMT